MPIAPQLALLRGERIVLEFGKGVLVLTNQRVRLDEGSSGNRRMVSITLGAVASCGIVATSYPWLVGASGLLLLGGLGMLVGAKETSGAAGFFIGGALALMIYLATRKSVLSIASAGEAIIIPVTGGTRAALVDFVDAVEREKLASAAASTEVESGRHVA